MSASDTESDSVIAHNCVACVDAWLVPLKQHLMQYSRHTNVQME